jgi:hypothetical protein
VHVFPSEVCFPARIPLFCVLVCQSCRQSGWHGSIQAIECSLYRSKETGAVKLKGSGNEPEIIEVFESAIGDPQSHHCVELFSNYSLDWIGANMRRREIEENGVVNLDRTRRNNVPKADVHLDGIRAPSMTA